MFLKESNIDIVLQWDFGMAILGLKRMCSRGISIKIISLKEKISSSHIQAGNFYQTLRSESVEIFLLIALLYDSYILVYDWRSY